jgi:hypothetical protein
MDDQQRTRLVRQGAVAKSSLTRMQTYINAGERKIHDLQFRYGELPNIFREFKAAQSELEQLDDFDHSADRESFEEQYYQVKSRFNELSYPLAHQVCQVHHKKYQNMKGVLQAPRILVLLVSSYQLLDYRLMRETTVNG